MHLKRPVLKFQQVEELKGSSLKMEAFENYVKVAKTLKSFEQAKYEAWLSESVPIVENTMHLDVLKVASNVLPDGKVLLTGELSRMVRWSMIHSFSS